MPGSTHTWLVFDIWATELRQRVLGNPNRPARADAHGGEFTGGDAAPNRDGFDAERNLADAQKAATTGGSLLCRCKQTRT
jgi:hypothetical protein